VNPNKPHALAAYEAGRLYLERDDAKNAVEAFQLTVREFPDLAEGHFNLAKAYERSGTVKKARESYQKVIELAPESRWAEEAKTQLGKSAR
jgi:tetratricopeptide (TPR) repeat protein